MNKISLEQELLSLGKKQQEAQFIKGINHLNSAIILAEELNHFKTAEVLTILLEKLSQS